MTTAARAAVEQAAIAAARSYAATNGYGNDRTVIGLILAGMVIGSRVRERTRTALGTGYASQHPAADHALWAWAEYLDTAADSVLDT